MKKTFVLRSLLILLSCAIVGFGQPAWLHLFCPLAAVLGFALFWIAALDCKSTKKLFWLSTLWYASVQGIQLSWMTSDIYQGFYIHILHFLLAMALGVQFGILTCVIRGRNLTSWGTVLGGAGIWVLMEWSRLHFLSGFSFNPAGMAMTWPIYTLQAAALGGVFFLSFWVMLTNLAILRAFALRRSLGAYGLWLAIAAAPYLFGWGHIAYHLSKKDASQSIYAALYQPGEPPKDILFQSGEDPFDFSWNQWKKLSYQLAVKEKTKGVDLLVLPEGFVFFGYSVPAYPFNAVKQLMGEQFKESYQSAALPPLQPPYAIQLDYRGRKEWFVTNAYWCQMLANLMQCDLVAGLSDVERHPDGRSDAYNSAFLFRPNIFKPERYEKRILVPMSEYLPFSFAKSLAAKYGITGSWTAGTEAKVFTGLKTPPINPTVCYEETFGHIVREGCGSGAKLIVNVTNDVWFPNSRLPRQHFDHALVRAVENGVPLVRSCNTGLTGAVDSLGNVVATLKNADGSHEWLCSVLYVDLPIYSYNTLYKSWGDSLILALSVLCFLLLWRSRNHLDLNNHPLVT